MMKLVLQIVSLVILLVLIAQVQVHLNVSLVMRMQLYNPIKIAHVAKDDQELLLYVLESIFQLFYQLMLVMLLKYNFLSL